MGLNKREYTDNETVITAENMNEIQDSILALEDGLLAIERQIATGIIEARVG